MGVYSWYDSVFNVLFRVPCSMFVTNLCAFLCFIFLHSCFTLFYIPYGCSIYVMSSASVLYYVFV